MTLTERINGLLTMIIKEEKQISQVELAKKMDVAPASVNKWLKGGAPAVDKLPILCEVLGITPNQLFGYETDDLHSTADFSETAPDIQIITDALSPVPAAHLFCGIKVPPSQHERYAKTDLRAELSAADILLQ